jgi:hypothetical protein
MGSVSGAHAESAPTTFGTILDHSTPSDHESILAKQKQYKDLLANNHGDNLLEKQQA